MARRGSYLPRNSRLKGGRGRHETRRRMERDPRHPQVVLPAVHRAMKSPRRVLAVVVAKGSPSFLPSDSP